MIGPRVGMKIGERIGIAGGVGSDELGDLPHTTLTIALVDSLDPVISFTEYDYTITVENTGPETAGGVTASLDLSPNTTFISGSGAGWAVTHPGGVGGTVVCTRPFLISGATAPDITINVRAPQVGETSSATARVSSANSPLGTPDTETTLVNEVDRDALKGVYLPSSTTQWNNFLTFNSLVATAPSHVWLCQETLADLNLADGIGTMTLTAANSPLYRQVASGWSRLGVAFDNGSNDRFLAAGGVGPDPNATSFLWLCLTHNDTEQTLFTNLMGINTLQGINSVRLNMSPLAGNNRLSLNSNGGNVNGALDHVAGDYAWALQYDRTNLRTIAMSSIERIVGVYNAVVTNGSKGIGDVSDVGGTQIVYLALFTGAAAELDQADIKALIQALGMPVTGW